MQEDNALIAEFVRRFSVQNETVENDDGSLGKVQRAIVEILQDYQRDIRSKGVPADWRLIREFRPGLFGKYTNKAFIFSDALSITTSRERLFIVDGLQDTKLTQDVVNAVEGSLLHALRPDAVIDDYAQLQVILARFSSDENLSRQLQERCQDAKINSRKTCRDLLGGNRLGNFINYTRVALAGHCKIFKDQAERKKFAITGEMKRLIQARRVSPPRPAGNRSTPLMYGATGCGASNHHHHSCGGHHGCGGGHSCGGHGCGGHGCGGGCGGH